MKNKDILHIENLFQDADYNFKPELYNKIIEELNTISNDKNDFQIEFYKGLAYYLNCDEEDFYIDAAATHMKKSLDINEKAYQAKMYLGYINFDLLKSKKSIDFFIEFLSATGEDLIKNDQAWRIVNILELISISFLRLGHYKNFTKQYNNWKILYYDFCEKDDFYFPRDLVLNITYFLKDKGNSLSRVSQDEFKKVSFDLIRLIKGADDYEELYRDELELLKNWDGQFQFHKSYYKV